MYEIEGLTAKLRLLYKGISHHQSPWTECVVDRLQQVARLADGGQAVSDVAVYAYTTDGGPERPGRLEQVTLPDKVWNYVYDGGQLIERLGGATTVIHNISSSNNKVATVTSSTENFALNWSVAASGCQPGGTCCGETMRAVTLTDNAAGRGDNVGGTAGFQRKYDILPNRNNTDQPRVYMATDSCSVAGACSPGTYRSEWSCTDGGFMGQEVGQKNKRNNWEVFSWGTGDAGLPYAIAEKLSSARGQTSLSSNDALETTSYSYVYGAGGVQLRHAETRASVFSAGGVATRKNWYSANNRIEKITQSGYTADSSQAVTQKFIATFYSTTRTCGGSAGPDPLGRTLEERGPCFVTGETATACSGASPVTVFEYYPSNDTTPNKNRLFRVRRYVNGSSDCASGTPLMTTYADYDARGNAGTITDENGVVTVYTYDTAGQLISRTVSSRTTRFAHDTDRLTRVMYPDGDGEVFCYRIGGDADCTTGTYSTLLQWRARKACSGAAGFTCTGAWSERADFAYAPDGTPTREEYRACDTGASCTTGTDGTLRRVLRYSHDAHKRATWRGFGDAPGSFSSTSFFDRADNAAGVGLAFNNAPAFCGGPNTGAGLPDEPVSKLCATLRYDRAERLASMTQYVSQTASGTTTCFGYDSNGNVVAVHTGCAGTTGCGANGVCVAQGASKSSQYAFDDFGNLVFADLPWTSNGAGGKGRWLYNHDEGGRVTYRRSPEQISLGANWYTTFSFDMLGRPTSAVAHTSGSNWTLFSMVYDAASVPANCPSATNGVGRLLRRDDAVGTTFFAYDTEGRLLSETLLKPGQTVCSTSNSRYGLTPTTVYTYTNDGALKTISYPQGRSVEYVYGSGANAARVASMKVQKREAGAWNWYTVLQNVSWEPYGGLRRYQVTPPGGAPFSAEYRQGDNSEAAVPANFCTATWSPGPDDHSGRLRALWVSSGLQGLGAGTGDLFRLWYKWRGEMPAEKHSCLLQESTPRSVAYGYDGLTQLVVADGGYPAGPHGLVGTVFDGRGNRASVSGMGASTLTTTYALPTNGDLLSSLTRSDVGTLTRTFGWDKNGRPASVAFGPNSTGSDSYIFGYVGGENLTFATVSIGGATYSYSYDALNRRGSKQYPSGVADDFFYDEGHQLLADRGVSSVLSAAPYPVDDYLWLAGRPIGVVRGVLDATWARQDDDSNGAACQRNGEAQACGFYFLLTDHLGTPVLALDSAARVTGTSEADPWGYPNRGAVSATTGAQPYGSNLNSVLGTFQVANAAAGTTTQVRARYAVLETEPTNDFVRLEEQSGATGTPKSGASSGPIWSDWLTLTSAASTKSVNVRFVSNATLTSAGVVTEAFEYRRYSAAAATPFFTPLRFPGQYHDAETDFFENWNRYYDPLTGRYLQSEPVLMEPTQLIAAATQAHGLPAYAYALNSPTVVTDYDGLQPRRPGSSPSPQPSTLPPDGSPCRGPGKGKVFDNRFAFKCAGIEFPVCVVPGNTAQRCASCYANANEVSNDLSAFCGANAGAVCDRYCKGTVIDNQCH